MRAGSSDFFSPWLPTVLQCQPSASFFQYTLVHTRTAYYHSRTVCFASDVLNPWWTTCTGRLHPVTSQYPDLQRQRQPPLRSEVERSIVVVAIRMPSTLCPPFIFT